MRRRWTTVPNGDVRIAVEITAWGRAIAGQFVLAHATGFCKEAMRPLVAALSQRLAAATVLAFDLRNHGASDRAGPLENWWPLGEDTAAVAAERRPVIGIGHSGGGAALAYAELIQPGTFAGLLLIDPILLPQGEIGPLEERLVRTAQRRRSGFASRAEALENFAEKRAFEQWTPEALEGYVEGGLRPGGEGFVLRCRPGDEANFYATDRRDSGWDRLGEITCPVRIVYGEHSDTHTPDFVAQLAARFGGATVDTTMVPGAGHFVPMEQPGAVAEAAVDFVALIDAVD